MGGPGSGRWPKPANGTTRSLPHPIRDRKAKPRLNPEVTRRWVRNESDERAVVVGFAFDEVRARFVVDWLRKCLALYEGDWAGQPFTCEDWQYEATMRLFGWVRFDAKRWKRWIRRFRSASIWVAKKNGKSPTLAAWALYLLCGDGEQGGKIFLGAKNGNQAREIAGRHTVEMVRSSPVLFATDGSVCKINWSHMSVSHEPTRSILRPLASDNVASQSAQEGLNGSVLIDETHVVDRRFVNRISRAGISRSEPLQIEVSTVGNDPDSYARERYDYGKRVESGEIKDLQHLFISYEAPQDVTDADLDADPACYAKLANPSWGRIVGEEEYLADYQQSKQSVSALADHKMYRLNIWQRSSNPWLRAEDWLKCRRDFDEADLQGEPCGAGLDLSKTEDMTALALVFPEGEADEETGDQPCKILHFYWLPEEAVQRHAHEVPYKQWQRDGFLRVLPGAVIDYSFVERDLVELFRRFDCRMLAYDVKYAHELMMRLVDVHGFDDQARYEFPQTIMQFAGPTARFERLVIANKMQHNGNPITTWQVGHVEVKHDANDNIRPVKPPHGDIRKIDGIVAGIMGLDAAMRMIAMASPYETRGCLYAGGDNETQEPATVGAEVEENLWSDGDVW